MFLDGTRGWNLTINESDIQNIIISETEYQSSEEEIESEDSKQQESTQPVVRSWTQTLKYWVIKITNLRIY